jgi:hypothetical protein
MRLWDHLVIIETGKEVEVFEERETEPNVYLGVLRAAESGSVPAMFDPFRKNAFGIGRRRAAVASGRRNRKECIWHWEKDWGGGFSEGVKDLCRQCSSRLIPANVIAL